MAKSPLASEGIGFSKDKIGGVEDFQSGFRGIDMDYTAELVTHLSIHCIQISVDFPNIITERSINLHSALIIGSC